MAKYCNPDLIDLALDGIATADEMLVLPSSPADYGAAQSAKLATASMTGGDFSKAAGDISGRKLTVGAKNGVSVTTPGTATHLALVDSGNSKLLYVTECGSQVLSSGTVDIGSWKAEIGDPA